MPEIKKASPLEKVPSGIVGLDELTQGGLPKGRPVLICGEAGSGKTLMAMEFLVRGATQFDEPGVFFAFEENREELAKNFASLGFDLEELISRKKLFIEFVYIDRSEIEEAGEYDLEGLFVRLGYAIDSIGAKRVVLDTIEAIFAGFTNHNILRAELRRLFRWLKERGVTAIITGERGEGRLTRHGLEEYISDCVIVLDHRISDQVATRRLRISKYRGSSHITGEVPFLIGENGLFVLPLASLGLQHTVSSERVSTGIPRLDTMLSGAGYYRGSTILVSGTAGTGKTSIAAQFIDAACRRGERALFIAFEESPSQFMRNMKSVGLDLQAWVDKGLLCIQADRAHSKGLELHLASIHRFVEDFKPDVVVIDPTSDLEVVGTAFDVRGMLTRLFDYLKYRGCTTLCTSLTHSAEDGIAAEMSGNNVTSLIDTWLLLRNLESGGERNRVLHILKSRGMAHSNQVREFVINDHGIELLDVYVGPAGVLTGTARRDQEIRDREAEISRKQEVDSRVHRLERRRAVMEARIAALKSQFESTEEELKMLNSRTQDEAARLLSDRQVLEDMRGADQNATKASGNSAPKKGRGPK